MPSNNINHSVIATFNTHTETKEALRQLRIIGFDMKQLSIIGRDSQTEGHVVGCYSTGDKIGYWGQLSEFWGGFWEILSGSGFFVMPDIGPVAVGGPLVTWIIDAVKREGGEDGKLSPVAAALRGIGIPEEDAHTYETSLKANKHLVVALGTSGEIGRARDILYAANSVTTNVYRSAAPS